MRAPRAGPGGHVDLSDAIGLLGELFIGGPASSCPAAQDANGSGSLDLSDAVYILNFAYVGGRAPPSPFPQCGINPTPNGLPCQANNACKAGCKCKRHRPSGITFDAVKVSNVATGGCKLTVNVTVTSLLLCEAGVGNCKGTIEVKESGGGGTVTTDKGSPDPENACGAPEAAFSQSFTYERKFTGTSRNLTHTLKIDFRTECGGVWSPVRTAILAVVTAAADADRVDDNASDKDGDGKTPAQGDTNDAVFDDADGDGIGDGHDPKPAEFNDRDKDGVGDGNDTAPDDPKVQ